MSNISQKKRAEMLAYLAQLKQQHTDDESICALNEIEAALTKKSMVSYEKNILNKLMSC